MQKLQVVKVWADFQLTIIDRAHTVEKTTPGMCHDKRTAF